MTDLVHRLRLVVRVPRPSSTTVEEEADQWIEAVAEKLPLLGGILLIVSVTVVALVYAIAVTPLVLGPYL